MKKIIAVDFYDLVWKQEKPFSREDMDALFARYKEWHVDAVLWRLSACGKLLYHSNTPDRYSGCPAETALSKRMLAVMADYDPAELAVSMGRKHGIGVYFWLTLFDDAGYTEKEGMESSISKAHPEYSWREIDGKSHYRGVLSYVYPEVVDFRLRQIGEILTYGADGLYLCNRSHSRSQVIREAMAAATQKGEDGVGEWCRNNIELLKSEFKRCRGRFGYDPPALETYNGDLDEVERWQRHRGGYFTAFMEKVRRINPGETWFGLRYGANLGPYIYGDHFFDWEKLSSGSIVDALAYDLQPPDFDSPQLFPEFYGQTKSMKLLWMHLSANPKATLNAYADSLARWRPFLDGIIMFEAYMMTDNPEYGEFLRNF